MKIFLIIILLIWREVYTIQISKSGYAKGSDCQGIAAVTDEALCSWFILPLTTEEL